ncbi:MAG: hypothetical protein COV74_09755 [Candidatus Omnitrophica bacterium CG11_big_fil_rev_8_21_14_0_20_45_26]|uniref:N-acetyltransferase domain-containing protein n=1 Tax=Candidatus Abzuiibacterium crystallinum TaxID=1974748 RepID=A0A2H0LNJ6_9BACT|nr:MAG: hypothetical protein COV74_09755 [Candidatus Omnitrophica bacterium CG11_big_fil_rev_8_21_14_0_20_45_26]PIW64493.1 MAG: hypothetical protein COW12_05880 [Candidatus Omnitrophica bacterium CG12_big_fil_rev_8_21_14_0_65_45_16]
MIPSFEPTAKIESTVQLRQAKKADESEIIQLCAKIFSLNPDYLTKIWQWLYHENPARSDDQPQGWVLISNGRVVGYSGSIPQWFRLRGEKVIFSFASCFCVLPPYQRHGIKLARQFLSDPMISYPMTNSANEKTAGIYKFFGCMEIRQSMKRMIWIRQVDQLIKLRLPAVWPGLAWPLQFVWSIVSGICRGIFWTKTRSRFLFDVTDKVPETLDALDERLCSLFPIASVRSREWLTWRLFAHPEKPYQLVLVRDTSQILAGYIVTAERIVKNNLKALVVLDIFCDDRDRKLLRSIVSYLLTQTERGHFDVLIIEPITDRIQSVLNGKGFVGLNIEKKTIVQNKNGQFSQTQNTEQAWRMSSLDGDQDTMIWTACPGDI